MTLPPDKLKIVARFLSAPEAHLARNRLEQEGVQAFLDSEHHISMEWMISNALGGVKLLVRARDLEIAEKILSQKNPPVRNEDTGDRTEFDASRESELTCPNCQSQQVQHQPIGLKVAFISILLLGFPLFFFKRGFVCGDCGHQWHPDKRNRRLENGTFADTIADNS